MERFIIALITTQVYAQTSKLRMIGAVVLFRLTQRLRNITTYTTHTKTQKHNNIHHTYKDCKRSLFYAKLPKKDIHTLAQTVYMQLIQTCTQLLYAQTHF